MKMASERESDPKVLLVPGSACRHGMKFTWGVGNQLFVFAGTPTSAEDEVSGEGAEAAYVHDVRWNTDMHDVYTRKLVNESNNIFLMLQSHEHGIEGTGRKPQLVKFSRNYRSVLKACIMDLIAARDSVMEEEVKKYYHSQMELFQMIELIWSLCEILFIETLPGGILLVKLLDWLKWHFNEGEKKARDVLREDTPEENPEYWEAVYCYVLQGRIEEARNMLSLHSLRQTDAYESMDELLRKMPCFTYFTGQSTAEFDMKWRHWQEESVRRLEDGEFRNHKNLETICKILIGDDQVFIQLKDLCECWYHMMVSKLLYQNPTVKAFDLQYHTQSCIDAYGGNSKVDPLENILLAAIEFDIHQVIKESSSYLSNWWFVSHLTDLLHHCGQLEAHKLNFGSNLREYLLLEYASGLMSHESLWQVGIPYLDHCPEFGRQYLEQYIEHIPLSSERKAHKVLRICEQRDMHDQANSICKVMGMKALHNDRLGSALSWCLKSKDVTFATYLAEQFLTRYRATGDFSNLDLLDNLGQAMLLSDRLTFLGKYREFHKLYEDGDFEAATSLLLSLLTARLAPKKFWLTLLTDALPLLEADEVVFTSQQTYELMHCLEELSLAEKLEAEEKTDQLVGDHKGFSDAELEKMSLIKLALTRNLARAIVHEGTVLT
ncbi:nuclear pore complex protein Nup85-like [Lingula anatina]|uniref:Nuclear pore complex protein Nup85 n=1 Tax=Lingula anatina TaxID=7574 RepID=A0A1S3H1W4_LINAN|nr:nuclear pore complex protein Nup85-like [Lingula anatina]|eukprot:XP_013379129.1 nuclear pore complex protein Nup85-like [Lingula anatina]